MALADEFIYTFHFSRLIQFLAMKKHNSDVLLCGFGRNDAKNMCLSFRMKLNEMSGKFPMFGIHKRRERERGKRQRKTRKMKKRVRKKNTHR